MITVEQRRKLRAARRLLLPTPYATVEDRMAEAVSILTGGSPKRKSPRRRQEKSGFDRQEKGGEDR